MKLLLLLIPLMVGLASLGVAIWDYRRTKALLRHGQRATGVYTGVERQVSSDTSDDGPSLEVTEYSLVEFQTPGGETVRVKGRTGGSGKNRLIGKPIEIVYDPADPQKARIKEFSDLWLLVLIMGILAAVFLLVTLVLWLLI